MNNTWGFANMKTTEPLRVNWKREIVVEHVKITKDDGNVFEGDYYALKYTRTRTKRWEYIGLTQEAAKACVAAMTEYLNRIQVKQQVFLRSGTAPHFMFSPARDPRNWNRVNCGTASSRQVSGDSFTVSVDLQEVLSFFAEEMTPIDNAQFVQFFEEYKWRGFETYPTGEWPQFHGGESDTFSLIKDFETFEKPTNDKALAITRTHYAKAYDGVQYHIFYGVAGNAVDQASKFTFKTYKHGTDIEVTGQIGPNDTVNRANLLYGELYYYNQNREVRDLEIVALDAANNVIAVSNRLPINYGV